MGLLGQHIQNSDLKFNLYRCSFTSNSMVIFDEEIRNPDTYSGFGILVSNYIPSGCSIAYEYALGNDSLTNAAKPLSQAQLVDLGAVASVFKIRAKLVATNWVSPTVMYGDNQSLLLEDRKISGAYVTRNVETDSDNKFKVAKVIVDVALPAGCSVSPQYLKDVEDSNSWTSIPPSVTPTAYLDGDYYTYYYEKDITEEAGDEAGLNNFKFKLAMVAGSKVDNIKIKKLRIILRGCSYKLHKGSCLGMPERTVDSITGFVRYKRTPEESLRKLRREVLELKKYVYH